MLKDLFDKGKCALGFHSGDWRYVDDRRCQQVRICPRCKNENEQILHSWQAWQYLANGACEMARQCGRCHEQENRLEHSWGAPVYETEGACTQARPCARCGAKSAAGTTHVWNSWTYDTKGQCAQTSACSRCGETGNANRIAHEWSDWHASKFSAAPVRDCCRCGEQIFDLGNGGTEKVFVSLQMVNHAVQDVISSTDSDGVRDRITRHSAVLFSPVAGKYFSFAVDQLAADADAKNTFRKLAGLIDRCRSEGVDRVFSPPVAPSASETATRSTATTTRNPAAEPGARDPRLAGHWRSTEILGAGSGFSHTIDTHCILDPAGRFQWFSRSSSGTSEPEQGTWSSSSSTLALSFGDGTQISFEYVIEGVTLFCPRESRYRLWQRVG
jgi:hypothetical protein